MGVVGEALSEHNETSIVYNVANRAGLCLGSSVQRLGDAGAEGDAAGEPGIHEDTLPVRILQQESVAAQMLVQELLLLGAARGRVRSRSRWQGRGLWESATPFWASNVVPLSMRSHLLTPLHGYGANA